MERSQFTFYSSYATALARIKNKAVRCVAYDAICAYALKGELPDLEALPDAAAIAFDLIRPTLDAAAKMSEGSKRRSRSSQGSAKVDARLAQGSPKVPSRLPQGSRNEGEKEKEKENEGEKENEDE